MRKFIVMACLAVWAGCSLSAQGNQKEQRNRQASAQQMPQMQPREKMSTEDMAKAMASRLMLDDATSSKFVTLYQEYLDKLSECKGEKKEKAEPNAKQKKAEPTDSEIDEQIQARFTMEENRLSVQKSYYDKFKKILTMKQVQKLYDRQRGGQGRGQGPAPMQGAQQGQCPQGGQQCGAQLCGAPQEAPQGGAPQGAQPQQ